MSVQIVYMELYGNKAKALLVWHDYADRQSPIFDNLLGHVALSSQIGSQ